VCALWGCGGYVTSYKMVSRRRRKRPNRILVRMIDGSQPAARDGEGWPRLPPAGVLFAVLSEMSEREVVWSHLSTESGRCEPHSLTRQAIGGE
jgi:hypothetical protein